MAAHITLARQYGLNGNGGGDLLRPIGDFP